MCVTSNLENTEWRVGKFSMIVKTETYVGRKGDKVLTENTIKNSDNGLMINMMENFVDIQLAALTPDLELTEYFFDRFQCAKNEVIVDVQISKLH